MSHYQYDICLQSLTQYAVENITIDMTHHNWNATWQLTWHMTIDMIHHNWHATSHLTWHITLNKTHHIWHNKSLQHISHTGMCHLTWFKHICLFVCQSIKSWLWCTVCIRVLLKLFYLFIIVNYYMIKMTMLYMSHKVYSMHTLTKSLLIKMNCLYTCTSFLKSAKAASVSYHN